MRLTPARLLACTLLLVLIMPTRTSLLELPAELTLSDLLVFTEEQFLQNPLAPWCLLALGVALSVAGLRLWRSRRKRLRKLNQIKQSIARGSLEARADREDLTGCQVGRYRLLSRLGEGAHADVYLASHRTSGMQFAIKVGEEQSAGELQLGRRLEHPNLVRVHGSGRCAYGAYLVMEYVPGETLRARLARVRLSEAEALDVFRQLCEGVAYAHQHSVVHGDLKPENIVVSPNREVKILDFGLARTVGAHLAKLAGTPEYMAPEHFLGKPGLSSDIYALGVILFEMLTSRLPFEPAECRDVVSARLSAKPPAPSSLVPGIHQKLDALCHDMLQRNPDRRIGDIAEVLSRLDRYASKHRSAAV